MLWIVVFTLLLIVLSATFSGSEAAIFSLHTWHIPELPIIKKLLNQPQRLIGTLLLGNLLVNTSATALFTIFLLKLSHNLGIRPAVILASGGVFMTIVILIGGEITPKVIATRNPTRFAKLVAPFISVTHWLFSPFTLLLEKLNSLFIFLPRESSILADDELHTMIEVGQEQGILLAGEEDILRNLLELDKRTVSEVMTP
ncbi:MAG: CNNM domain-containing protein, partial [bacterium]